MVGGLSRAGGGGHPSSGGVVPNPISIQSNHSSPAHQWDLVWPTVDAGGSGFTTWVRHGFGGLPLPTIAHGGVCPHLWGPSCHGLWGPAMVAPSPGGPHLPPELLGLGHGDLHDVPRAEPQGRTHGPRWRGHPPIVLGRLHLGQPWGNDGTR